MCRVKQQHDCNQCPVGHVRHVCMCVCTKFTVPGKIKKNIFTRKWIHVHVRHLILLSRSQYASRTYAYTRIQGEKRFYNPHLKKYIQNTLEKMYTKKILQNTLEKKSYKTHLRLRKNPEKKSYKTQLKKCIQNTLEKMYTKHT